MVNNLLHSPADIMRWVLVDQGYGTTPSAQGAWPVYASAEPTAPDNVITLYDTVGRVKGRTMIDGVLYIAHGFQVRVRAIDHPTGWAKMDALQKFLSEDVLNLTVHVTQGAGARYSIRSVVDIGAIMVLGKDPNSGRSLFTLNALANLKAL